MLNGEDFLEVDGLEFRRGARAVLRDVSFAVKKGEFLCITGPNGSGKTTLLQCLLRFHRPDRGTIRLAGRPLADYDRRELAKWLGYVPQSHGDGIPFTTEDFVLLSRYPLLKRFQPPGPEDRRAVREALEKAGVAGFAQRPVSSLSGGERQRVFLAAALAQGSPILLLDEPTTFLDPRHQVDMRGLLRRLHSESRATIVMVTHDINLAALCGERVLALREGQPAFFGPSIDFLTQDVLERIYGVPFEIVIAPSRRLAVHKER
jgi:iron complex transport system ATP-binding protein